MKYIFIHISKCAGMSVSSMIPLGIDYLKYEHLSKYRQHSKYLEYELTFNKKIKDFFIFTFVRNPYDRLLSLYTYWRENKAINLDNICIDGLNIAEASWKLSEFNEWVGFIGLNYGGRHLENQTEWLLNTKGNIESSVWIGRFEKFEE